MHRNQSFLVVFCCPRDGVRRQFSARKTKSSIRTVPSGSALREAFLCHRGSAPDESLVCAGRNGTPLNAKNILRRGIRSTCQRLGLPLITCHSFRHTHATLLSDLGKSRKSAQSPLDHACLSTTAEFFTHAGVASQQASVERGSVPI